MLVLQQDLRQSLMEVEHLEVRRLQVLDSLLEALGEALGEHIHMEALGFADPLVHYLAGKCIHMIVYPQGSLNSFQKE
jgi:hypothetical protein